MPTIRADRSCLPLCNNINFHHPAQSTPLRLMISTVTVYRCKWGIILM